MSSMFRIISVTLVLLPCVTSVLHGQPATDFLRGDVDGNGCVEAVPDTIYLLQNLFPPPGAPPLPIACLDAADINDTGNLNIADAVGLLGWGFPPSGTTPPVIPAPGPVSCGPDPTPDTLDCASYVCAPCTPAVPDPDLVLSISTLTPGPTFVPVEVRFDSDETLAGLSFGVCHAPGITPTAVTQGTTLAALNGGAGPALFDVLIEPSAGWRVGIVTDFFLVVTLPPGTGMSIAVAEYDCTGGGAGHAVTFCETIGTPPSLIRATRPDGTSLIPTVLGGAIDCAPPPPGSFVRGDVSGDGVLDLADAALLEQFLFPGVLPFGPPPEPVGCDLVPNQSGDINDNEVETIADLLMFQEYLGCGGITIPGPSSCGDDPDDSTTGFDVIDTEYLVSAYAISVTGDVDQERDVTVTLRIKSPLAVKAVAIGLELGSQLSLADPPLTMAPGVAADFFGVLVDGSFIMVAAGSTTCATPMMASSDILAALGTLHLKLAPFAVFPPVALIQETTILGHIRRTTVVDVLFQDHQPFFMSGEASRFARGNANNFDALVDIADPVYILGHLFPQPTSLPLDCLDAADANNDGQIDIADPIYALAFLFAGGPIIPAPYPQCGFDQDIDGIDLANPGTQCVDPFCP